MSINQCPQIPILGSMFSDISFQLGFVCGADGIPTQFKYNRENWCSKKELHCRGKTIFFPNVRDDQSPLASGMAPAREADQQEPCQKSRRDGDLVHQLVGTYFLNISLWLPVRSRKSDSPSVL